jgi:hypothetical protein
MEGAKRYVSQYLAGRGKAGGEDKKVNTYVKQSILY